MLDLMADPRVLVSSPSSLPMTLAMLFNNSTATIGKVALLRFVKIALQVALVSVDEVVLARGVDLEEVLEVVVVALEVVVADLEEAEVALGEGTEAPPAVVMKAVLEQQQQLQILSQTMRLPELTEARQSMFEM